MVTDTAAGVPGIVLSDTTNDFGTRLALDFLADGTPLSSEPVVVFTVGNDHSGASAIVLTATEISALVEILNELTGLGVIV